MWFCPVQPVHYQSGGQEYYLCYIKGYRLTVRESVTMAGRLTAEVKTPKGCKLEFSIERTIEATWERSQHAGWSFPRFFMHVFAILIVLRQRDRWAANAVSQRKKKPKKRGAHEARPSV